MLFKASKMNPLLNQELSLSHSNSWQKRLNKKNVNFKL